MIPYSSRACLGGVVAGLASLAALACASTQKPASLIRAEGIYAALQTQHADQRVEGDVIRTRAALDTAQTAVSEGQNQDYTEGVADIALRTAQTAEAHYARAVARQATDSLEKLRLARMLAAAQARQAALEAKQAVLERLNAAATARADSLAAANQAKLPAAVPAGADGPGAGGVPGAVAPPDSSARSPTDTTRRPPS
jgi:hypothetical protein